MVKRLLDPFQAFFRLEAAGGLVLMASAACALAAANSGFSEAYEAIWQTRLTVGVAPAQLSKPLLLWINDGLMAIFFLLVGLEIKREFRGGELATQEQAGLAIAAATGGMLVPAGLYAAVNAGGPGAAGWGIPMATDIAFALGVLALSRAGASIALRVFLTAMAIVDDLGAVLVIALFYTEKVDVPSLTAAAAVAAALVLMNLGGVRAVAPYLVLGVVLWTAMLLSGLHATIAGVLLALTISHEPGPTAESPLSVLEHGLHPWVSFLILPVFALANAGVAVDGESLRQLAGPVGVGVMLGLLVGKPVGVLALSWAAVRLGLARLPEGVSWRQIGGAAVLAGIGFTMSLFIAGLAFVDPAVLRTAKGAILVASLMAGLTGWAMLQWARPAPGDER